MFLYAQKNVIVTSINVQSIFDTKTKDEFFCRKV